MDGANEVTSFSDVRVRNAKLIMLLGGIGILLLIFKSMSKHPNGLVESYMAVVGLGIAWLVILSIRACRLGIFLTEDRLVVRSVAWTHSWRWEEVRDAETIERVAMGGPLGLGMARVAKLAEPTREQVTASVLLRNGKRVYLRGLRITVRRTSNGPTWLDEAVRAVRLRLEARGQRVVRPS